MKNILVTAATKEELEGGKIAYNNFISQGLGKELEISFLETGIGVNSTTYNLTKGLLTATEDYDMVVNIGIAGTYVGKLDLGSVVVVNKEQFADLGMEGRLGFQSLFEYEILDANTLPYVDGALYCREAEQWAERICCPCVSGVTVQTVTGDSDKNDAMFRKFSPEIETMEGAAFFYVCLMENIPFVALRGVSNKVGERDITKWEIEKAMAGLSAILLELFKTI